MQIKELVAVAGKPGLYKVVARSNKGLIVEALDDKKSRLPVNANNQVSLLEDITIYTIDDQTLTLGEVLNTMQEKVAEFPVPDIKDHTVKIRDYFRQIAPTHDEERVYISDLKKILKWFEILSSRPEESTAEENSSVPD